MWFFWDGNIEGFNLVGIPNRPSVSRRLIFVGSRLNPLMWGLVSDQASSFGQLGVPRN